MPKGPHAFSLSTSCSSCMHTAVDRTSPVPYDCQGLCSSLPGLAHSAPSSKTQPPPSFFRPPQHEAVSPCPNPNTFLEPLTAHINTTYCLGAATTHWSVTCTWSSQPNGLLILNGSFIAHRSSHNSRKPKHLLCIRNVQHKAPAHSTYQLGLGFSVSLVVLFIVHPTTQRLWVEVPRIRKDKTFPVLQDMVKKHHILRKVQCTR